LNFLRDFFDLFLGCFRLEDDNHEKRSKYHIPLQRQIRKTGVQELQEFRSSEPSEFGFDVNRPQLLQLLYSFPLDNLTFSI
jgi:hypothetical protein